MLGGTMACCKKIIRKRLALARIKTAIRLAKIMDHTLIAYQVVAPAVNALKKTLKKELENVGVEATVAESPLHISVAHIPGSYDEETLEKLLLEGKLKSPFKGESLVFLEGDEYNYISVKLEPPVQYKKFQEEISHEVKTKKFPGGFKAHISLIKGLKNKLTRKVFDKIKDSVNTNIDVTPIKILLYNKDHQIEHVVRI